MRRLIFGSARVGFMTPAEKVQVIDADMLPAQDIYVPGIKINGVVKWIEQVFASKALLVKYLNCEFIKNNKLFGCFINTEFSIFYENNDNFDEVEIMVSFSSYNIVLKIGTPPEELAPTLGWPANYMLESIPNGSPFTSSLLLNKNIDTVVFNTIIVQPGKWNKDGNTLVTVDTFINGYLFLECSQVPASSSVVDNPTGLHYQLTGSSLNISWDRVDGVGYELREAAVNNVYDSAVVYEGTAGSFLTTWDPTTSYYFLIARQNMKLPSSAVSIKITNNSFQWGSWTT